MLRIFADNHNFAFSLDYLALFADRLYRSSYFHSVSSSYALPLQVILPLVKSYGDNSTLTLSPVIILI